MTALYSDVTEGIRQLSTEPTRLPTDTLTGFHDHREVWQQELTRATLLGLGPQHQHPAQVRDDFETHCAPGRPARQDLTERQQAVLALVLEGLPNKLIARRLGLTVNTVKEHVSAILQRLGSRTRTQLLSGMKPFRSHEAHAGEAANATHEQPDGAAPNSPPIKPKDLGLTSRQGTVLLHLLDGLSNKAIARHVGLTENTVKEHVSAILNRLGARTRMQLISQMRHFAPPPVSDPDSAYLDGAA